MPASITQPYIAGVDLDLRYRLPECPQGAQAAFTSVCRGKRSTAATRCAREQASALIQRQLRARVRGAFGVLSRPSSARRSRLTYYHGRSIARSPRSSVPVDTVKTRMFHAPQAQDRARSAET